jgi:methionyl-tRNA synthetase
MSTFYLTTPIYYPNARPHVGSAYTTIVCDVLARYKRMCGYDVAFLTGTDEHGEKLERAAAAAGMSPSDFVTEKRKLFVELWEKLDIPVKVYPESDRDSLRFIYTTHPDHRRSVRRMLLRAKSYPLRYCANCKLYVHGVAPPSCPKCDGTLEPKAVIYKRQYQGRYCVSDERYISDGTDPVNCDICGRPAESISEENYFFRLSAFGPSKPDGDDGPLLSLYRDNPNFVQPSYRMNEVKSFVRSGLRDISVSRKRIKWGIPFPLDAERDDPEQVVYVWYDALTSYMTGIGYAQGENGSAEFQKYWRNKPGESEIFHMMAKDILRFHAVYWPAFIMAAYPNQPEMLPTTVYAHGWIYYEQDKMSKSKGNVVYPEPIIDALDSFGAPGNDALRYYLLRDTPFGLDGNFSYGGLIDRYNFDLANDLGNLTARTIAMINQYFNGVVPKPEGDLTSKENQLRVASFGPDESIAQAHREPLPAPLGSSFMGFIPTCIERFQNCDFSNAIGNLWYLIGEVNKYLVITQPWAIAQSILGGGPARLSTILYTAADSLRTFSVALYPVVPDSAERIWKQLGCKGNLKDQNPNELKWGQLKPGTKVGKAEPIFPRLDKAATLAKLDELSEADRERGKPTVGALREAPLQADLAEADRNRDKPKEAFIPVQTEKKPEAVPLAGPEDRIASPQPLAPSPQSPAPSLISIEDFAKVDMRVGEVKAAEHVPGASKLLKLMVDIGAEVRQLVAGLAEYYQPENLIGMKVVVVTNLQPRKLRGVESNGMIVAALAGEPGRPVLVTFKEDVANGARLK